MARKKKLKRNISGLRNQPKQLSLLPSLLPIQTHGANLDAELDAVPSPKWELDSMKTQLHAASDGRHVDIGPVEERGDVDLGVEGSHANLMTSVGDHGDNPRDEDWVPKPSKRKAIKGKRGRPSSYKKGPDVGSRSARTIYRYRKLLSGQTNLGSFGFQARPKTRKNMERANCVVMCQEFITPPPPRTSRTCFPSQNFSNSRKTNWRPTNILFLDVSRPLESESQRKHCPKFFDHGIQNRLLARRLLHFDRVSSYHVTVKI